jgi:hypothetical protein
LFFAGAASADSVWTYSGNSTNKYSQNPFAAPTANPCGCALQASITFDSANQFEAWSFTAGNLTLTNLNSTLSGFLGPEQPGWGLPSYWYLDATGLGGQTIITKWGGSIDEALDQGGNLSVGSNPGFWTDPVATPEPSTLLMLGAGLLGLLARQRMAAKRSRNPEAVWEPLA